MSDFFEKQLRNRLADLAEDQTIPAEPVPPTSAVPSPRRKAAAYVVAGLVAASIAAAVGFVFLGDDRGAVNVATKSPTTASAAPTAADIKPQSSEIHSYYRLFESENEQIASAQTKLVRVCMLEKGFAFDGSMAPHWPHPLLFDGDPGPKPTSYPTLSSVIEVSAKDRTQAYYQALVGRKVPEAQLQRTQYAPRIKDIHGGCMGDALAELYGSLDKASGTLTNLQNWQKNILGVVLAEDKYPNPRETDFYDQAAQECVKKRIAKGAPPSPKSSADENNGYSQVLTDCYEESGATKWRREREQVTHRLLAEHHAANADQIAQMRQFKAQVLSKARAVLAQS